MSKGPGYLRSTLLRKREGRRGEVRRVVERVWGIAEELVERAG